MSTAELLACSSFCLKTGANVCHLIVAIITIMLSIITMIIVHRHPSLKRHMRLVIIIIITIILSIATIAINIHP